MGQARARVSATARFVARYPFCFFCGGVTPATTREHMPPTSLFNEMHRPNDLIMPACFECNSQTSTADLTASIISRWDANPITDDQKKLTARVLKQAPELVREWTKIRSARDRRNAKKHLERYGVSVPADASILAVGPHTITMLNLFAHKVVAGLYFHHFKSPLPITGGFSATWKTKEDIAAGDVPERLLAMMPRYGTIAMGKWVESDTFEYLHDINPADGLFACFAKFRKGLFVIGFAARDGSALPKEIDWINPAPPSHLLALPHFAKRF